MTMFVSWLLALSLAWPQKADAPPVRAAPVSSQSAAEPTPPISKSPAQELDEHLALIRGNNTPEARRFGAAKLLETGTDEAIGRLVEILLARPGELAAQVAVCEAVSAIDHLPGAALADPLIGLLGDSRAGLSDSAAAALRRFDAASVIKNLHTQATDPRQGLPKRLAAVNALGTLGDETRATTELAALLGDPSPSVRVAALNSFNQVTGMRHENPSSALAWWKGHAEMSPLDWLREVSEARRARIRTLQLESSDLTRRLVAAYREAYLHTPEQNRPKKLLEFLADEAAAVRILGLDLINDLMTDRKEVSAEIKARLVEMVPDLDERVRVRVAKTVGDLRLAAAMSKLIEAVAQEIDPIVRAAQVNALGRLNDAAAIPALSERLGDESPAVVGEAASALGVIARRGGGDASTAEKVASRLAERFEQIASDEDEVRERFLVAMTSIAAESFRPVFQREMKIDRNVRIRRVAIAGLSALGDVPSAEDVRVLIGDPEPEIRLATVEALSKCGRSRGDLEALSTHLDSEKEPDAAVRQRAWEGYLLIAQRLPAEEQIRVSDSFNRSNDPVSQRRRVELLKALRSSQPKLEQLSRDRRIDVLDRLADAQMELHDLAAAAVSLDQAMGTVQDPKNERYAVLAAKSIAALLHGREDSRAIQRIKELTDGDPLNGEVKDAAPLAKAILSEVRARVDAATDAATFAEAVTLIDAGAVLDARAGPSFRTQMSALRGEVQEKRTAIIDRLLAALSTDPEAETKLIGQGREAVLPLLCEKLAEDPPTSAPAQGSERRLIKLAKRLCPDWPGFEPNAEPAQRAAALRLLREPAPTATRPASPVANGSAHDSRRTQ